MEFTVILSRERDGGYSVFCPAVPGAVSQGDSREEALVNIVDAIQGCLEITSPHTPQPLQETPALIAAAVAEVLGYRLDEEMDYVIETAVVPARILVPA